MPENKQNDPFVPNSIRPMTRHLYENLVLDLPISLPSQVDFGIDSVEHYAALQFGVRRGEITLEQLDAALGNGIELTKLARGVTSTPFQDIVYVTSWDAIDGRDPIAEFGIEPPEEEREP